MSSFLDAALWYARQGFPVFPCAPRAKTPLTAHGFKDATTDESKIREWWTKTPDANLAVPTGTPSGWFAVDTDPRHGGDKTWEALMVEHGLYPVTAEQATGGGGRHYIFKDPGVKCPSTLGPGIDLKSTGGYILVAPSVHPSGGVYRFDDPKKLLDLPEAPEWTYRTSAKGESQPTEQYAERNKGLTQLAGAMRRAGMSVAEIRAALDVARVERCNPPLPMDEIEKTILKSAATWEQGRIVCAVKEPIRNAESIFEKEIEPMDWNIENLIPGVGVAVLAARPKMGKSFLALQFALSVANGTPALGKFKTGAPRRVLYFGLEDSIRRIQTRLRMLHSDAVARRNLDFRFTLRFDVDGFASLDSNLSEAVAEGRPYSLVVIDTFLNAVLGRNGKMDPVRADYQEMRLLSEITQKHNVGILLVHHSRKSVRGDDPGSLDVVLGTTGMTAASDSIILLSRKPATDDEEESRLMCATGKDVDLNEPLDMEFNPAEGGWKLLGVASHLHASKEKKAIFELLEGKAEGMTPADIAKDLGKKAENVRQMLKKMHDRDEVVKDEDDKYRLPQKQDKLPFSSPTVTEPPPVVFYEPELEREAA